MNDDLLASIERAASAVEPLLDSITPHDHARATPCPDLDVRGLAAHLIGGLSGFADVAEGKPLAFDADPDLQQADPAAEFRTAVERLVTCFSTPGAVDRTYTMPWGETSGAQLLGFELIELIVHGWDIARALGRQPTYDDDLVAATLTDAQLWVDDSARVPQLFGPEVEVARDAPVLDRLVGFLGRNPTWAPSASLATKGVVK